MAREVNWEGRGGPATWWLALVEVRKPAGGILFAEEVEGGFAWAAADARRRAEAETMIRGLFARHGFEFARFEAVFTATLDDIDSYDRMLAAQLARQSGSGSCARGPLAFFAAEAEA